MNTFKLLLELFFRGVSNSFFFPLFIAPRDCRPMNFYGKIITFLFDGLISHCTEMIHTFRCGNNNDLCGFTGGDNGVSRCEKFFCDVIWNERKLV